MFYSIIFNTPSQGLSTQRVWHCACEDTMPLSYYVESASKKKYARLGACKKRKSARYTLRMRLISELFSCYLMSELGFHIVCNESSFSELEIKTEQRAISKTFNSSLAFRTRDSAAFILESHRESAKSAECLS